VMVVPRIGRPVGVEGWRPKWAVGEAWAPMVGMVLGCGRGLSSSASSQWGREACALMVGKVRRCIGCC
jgi:hypothetical protein